MMQLKPPQAKLADIALSKAKNLGATYALTLLDRSKSFHKGAMAPHCIFQLVQRNH
jgi:hypothetical protein